LTVVVDLIFYRSNEYSRKGIMAHRDFKDPLYAQFARIGHALASPVRIELLDLLAQGEKTVESLAEHTTTSIKNVSAHLRVLRQARLVETRRAGTYIHYRLADADVGRFVRDLQRLGQHRLTEVEQVARQYIDDRDELEPVTQAELRKLVRDGQVTVIDVRPVDEYEAGHIPGALSIPVAELKRRLRDLPKRRQVIAYCRGPYCVFSLEAVTLLRKHGFDARRADDGLPAWRDAGLPIAVGA
jgi:rhodanese-related sulfurtransferase